MPRQLAFNTLLLFSLLLLSISAFAKVTGSPTGNTQDQVLVTIDGASITRGDLQTAISSSPFYTQFNTLDENTQASIRGDFLKRLVAAKLLAAEAHRQGIDQSAAFRKELDEYAKGLLYQQYTNGIRQNITLDEKTLNDLRKQYPNNTDAFSAAKSSAIATRYKALLKLALLKLRDSFAIKLYEDRISKDISPSTVLMEGKDNLKLTYKDIIGNDHLSGTPDKKAIQDKLYQLTEFLLITKAAEAEKLDINKQLARYKAQRLPALLVEQKSKEWVKDEQTLRDYFQQHPEMGASKGQWHIGQLVLASEAEAKEAEKLIKSGKKSLFELAGERSIDPYGKANNGDMGWLQQESGTPAIEKALENLPDQQLSPIIKTSKGYHLVTILERKPGQKLGFGAIKDKIRQRIISENMAQYLQHIQKNHTVSWQVLDTDKQHAEKLAKEKHTLEDSY